MLSSGLDLSARLSDEDLDVMNCKSNELQETFARCDADVHVFGLVLDLRPMHNYSGECPKTEISGRRLSGTFICTGIPVKLTLTKSNEP